MSIELLVQYAFAVRRNQEHIQKRLLQEIKTASASMADELVQRNMKDTKMLLPQWAFNRIEVQVVGTNSLKRVREGLNSTLKVTVISLDWFIYRTVLI